MADIKAIFETAPTFVSLYKLDPKSTGNNILFQLHKTVRIQPEILDIKEEIQMECHHLYLGSKIGP